MTDRPLAAPRLLAALAMATLVALPVRATDTASPEVANKVVIRVNDRIATLFDYEARRTDMESEILHAELPLAQRRQLAAEIPERAFSDLYQEMLLLSRADQLNVAFTDEEVDAQIQSIRDRNGFDEPGEFEQALAQSGMTLTGFREQLRKNMRIQDVLGREVRSKIEVDDELARRYYKEHPDQFQRPQRLRLQEVVVLADSGLGTDERQALAESLREELVAGRSIAELAEDNKGKGLTSGLIDLGWVASGDLAPELEEAVWKLPAGAVSEPTESRGGTHLVQVEEREEAGLRPFNEIVDEVKNRAGQETYQDKLAEYLEKLEKRAYIELDPPPGAESFRTAAPDAALTGLDGTAATPEQPVADAATAPAEPIVPPDASPSAGGEPQPALQPPPPPGG